MADRGTITALKAQIDLILNNAVADKFITPQKHNNILQDVIDTLFPSFGSVTGTDTYVVAMSITQVALMEGKLYLLSFANTNTGAVTLNVDALGAKAITKDANVALAASDVVIGKIYEVRYHIATDNFRIDL